MTEETNSFTKLYDYVMRDEDLTLPMKLVYSYLLRLHESVDNVFPSNATIARNTSLSVATVNRATTALEGMRLITKVPRFNDSNLFLVHSLSNKVLISS